MRILFLVHAFNSLSQRLFVDLRELGHEVSVEFDIADSVTIEAVDLFRPHLIVAPYLKRAIPETVWRAHRCLVVHPGVKGDRGPSALDRAILEAADEWAVTCFQAGRDMDAGDIWSSASFPMRAAGKGSLYRNEVTEAAAAAVVAAVGKAERGGFRPQPLDYGRPEVKGRWRPALKQCDRAIDWNADDKATVLRKIHSADGNPGLLDSLFGEPVYLYDAHAEDRLKGDPGAIIGRQNGAVCRATVDGAVWVGHLRRKGNEPAFKLPATMVLGELLKGVPDAGGDGGGAYRDILYEERGRVGYLHFTFHNGAMSTAQCRRLREAFRKAKSRDTRVIVLMGGPDFWSNGIHLNVIEAAASPADESWRNINAMNDLAREIIVTDTHLVIAALQGNAGAGGVFLALAADKVVARSGVVLNPHYKDMGNLYGSEYWTYLLPRRAGKDNARDVIGARLPVGAAEAQRLGMVDAVLGGDVARFRRQVEDLALSLATDPSFPALLSDKARRRAHDEAEKPLEDYRNEELERMKLNFYGFDTSYHVARYNFVHKVPKSRTPASIARHRRRGAAAAPSVAAISGGTP